MNPTISRLQVAPHKTTTLWAACAITYVLPVLLPLSTVRTLFEKSITIPGLIGSARRLCNWRVKNARGIYFIRSQFPGYQREKLDNMFHMTICRSWRICDRSSIRQRSIVNLHISTVTRSKCKRQTWKKCFLKNIMSSLETLSCGIKSSLSCFRGLWTFRVSHFYFLVTEQGPGQSEGLFSEGFGQCCGPLGNSRI